MGGWFSPSNHVLGNKLRSVRFVSAELAPLHFSHTVEKRLGSKRWYSYCHSSETSIVSQDQTQETI